MMMLKKIFYHTRVNHDNRRQSAKKLYRLQHVLRPTYDENIFCLCFSATMYFTHRWYITTFWQCNLPAEILTKHNMFQFISLVNPTSLSEIIKLKIKVEKKILKIGKFTFFISDFYLLLHIDEIVYRSLEIWLLWTFGEHMWVLLF